MTLNYIPNIWYQNVYSTMPFGNVLGMDISKIGLGNTVTKVKMK